MRSLRQSSCQGKFPHTKILKTCFMLWRQTCTTWHGFLCPSIQMLAWHCNDTGANGTHPVGLGVVRYSYYRCYGWWTAGKYVSFCMLSARNVMSNSWNVAWGVIHSRDQPPFTTNVWRRMGDIPTLKESILTWQVPGIAVAWWDDGFDLTFVKRLLNMAARVPWHFWLWKYLADALKNWMNGFLWVLA